MQLRGPSHCAGLRFTLLAPSQNLLLNRRPVSRASEVSKGTPRRAECGSAGQGTAVGAAEVVLQGKRSQLLSEGQRRSTWSSQQSDASFRGT